MTPLEIAVIPNGRFSQNCYLVYPPGQAEAALVDPGEETGRFFAEAAERRVRITAIWLTHAHVDHIVGVGAVHQATGAPIYLHPADLPLYENLAAQAAAFGFQAEPAPPPGHALAHGQRLELGGVQVEVRHAPGHSPGHVCFVVPGAAIVGDVIFQGSIGRTDLPGGDYATLIASIRRELLSLPDETVLHPGHGPATTVGRERADNPFLRGGAGDSFPPA